MHRKPAAGAPMRHSRALAHDPRAHCTLAAKCLANTNRGPQGLHRTPTPQSAAAAAPSGAAAEPESNQNPGATKQSRGGGS